MEYGTIKVRGREAGEVNSIVLTFVDRRIFDDTKRTIMKSAGLVILDDFWGYKIFESVEDAVETASIFCR